jgi:hypothetical protein
MIDLQKLLRDRRHKSGGCACRAHRPRSGTKAAPRSGTKAAPRGDYDLCRHRRATGKARVRSTTKAVVLKWSKPPRSAASFKGGSTLALFELARNAAEGRIEVGAEGIDYGNNRRGDTCCDQAIFDRRRARFIPSESNKQSTHVGLLY